MFFKYRGELLLLLTSIIAALGWFFSKNAIHYLPPIGFNSIRFGSAALLLLPFSWKYLKGLTTEQWKHSSVAGMCLVFSITCYVLGLNFSTELGKASFISSLSMLIAPIVAWMFFKERPKSIFAVSLTTALVGLYFLNNRMSLTTLSMGEMFFVGSAIGTAVQYAFINRYARTVPVLALLTVTLGMVGIVNGAYSMVYEVYPAQLDEAAWLWVGLSVVFATAMRFMLQMYGQKYSDVANGAAIMLLEPIWTMILSIILMDENLGMTKLLGCCLIFSSLFIYRMNVDLGKLFIRKKS